MIMQWRRTLAAQSVLRCGYSISIVILDAMIPSIADKTAVSVPEETKLVC